MKKVILIISLILFLAILFVVATPFIFQDRLNEFVIKEINRNPDVDVFYKDPKVRLFKHFPDITVEVRELSISPKSKKTSLFKAEEIFISFDLFSVLGGKSTDINSLGLVKAEGSYIVKEDGSSNWDFLLVDGNKSDDAGGANFSLEEYYIEKSSLVYKDLQNDLNVELKKIDHSGKGDFSSTAFKLSSSTTAVIENITIAGESYLDQVDFGLLSEIDVDLVKESYVLSENLLKLNGLEILVDGIVNNGDQTTVDLKLKTNNNSIVGLLSLTPVFKDKLGDIKTDGILQIEGFVKGIMADAVYPDFEIKSTVSKGSISLADMAHQINNINMKANISKLGNRLDDMKVDIKEFNATANGKKIEGRLMMTKLFSDPVYDAAVRGKLYLEDLMPYVTDTELKSMAGLIDLDVKLKASQSQLLEGKGNVQSSGLVGVEKASFESTAFPEVLSVTQAKFEVSDRNLKVSKFNGKFGKSDLAVLGSVNRIFDYLFSDGNLIGDLTMNSSFFDINPWLQPDGSEDSEIYPIPENLDLTVFATISKVLYEDIDLENVAGRMKIKEGKLIYEKVKANTMGGRIEVDGTYMTKNGKASVDMKYDIVSFDIAKTANKLGIVKGFLPVASYLEGKVSSTMDLRSDFTNEMLFDLKTISGNGNIRIPIASIKNMPLMDKISATTGLNTSGWKIQDAWTVIKINKGRLAVEPFTVKVGGYDMLVSGSNGLDRSIDYMVKLDVPSNKLGGASATVQDWLKTNPLPGSSQLIPNVVRFTLGITGSLTDPKVAIKSIKNGEDKSIKEEAKQIIKETVDKEKEKIETEVKETIKETKTKVEKEIEEKKDEVKEKADKEIEETKEKAKEKAKEIFKIP